MLHRNTHVRIGLGLLAGVLFATVGCQTPSHETGDLYVMSEQFDRHVGQHMPMVFEKSGKEPWLEITFCKNVAAVYRPEVAMYNVHVTILSTNEIYDLQDNRIEFIADGARISLARVGAYQARPKQYAANYPINVHDLTTLAGAREVRIRVRSAEASLDRTLDPTHLAALNEFYAEVVEVGTGTRRAGVND